MANTLATATLAIAKLLPGPHILVESVATATGTTATLKDTVNWFVGPGTLPPDDYFNGGTIWFKDMTTALSEGLTSIITDYATAGTFTFAPVLTLTTVALDTYAACPRYYPRFILRQAVNYALAEVGGEDAQDVSLTTVDDQMIYDLPSGVYNVKRVEVATASSTPYGYRILNHWREINDDIVFDEGYQLNSTDYIIRLTYRVPFTELTTDNGATPGTQDATCLIPDLADMNWIKWAGAAYCLRWKLGMTGRDEPTVREMLQEAITRAEMQAARYRPKMQQMYPDVKHSPWATGSVDDTVAPGTVRLK